MSLRFFLTLGMSSMGTSHKMGFKSNFLKMIGDSYYICVTIAQVYLEGGSLI